MNLPFKWSEAACCAALGFTASWLGIIVILRGVNRAGIPVRPCEFHNENPVPRLGGLALMLAFILTSLCVYLRGTLPTEKAGQLGLVLIGALAMFALGLRDDFRSLDARFKLAVQSLVAMAMWLGGVRIEVIKAPLSGVEHGLGMLGLVATVAWLVGLTNLINLVDGIDGLAGGIALMLMVLLANFGTGGDFTMPLAVGTAGALLAFLRFNYPPAKIHLGDGGAYLLGFLIGILAILNSNKGTVLSALVAPAFALALPIADTALTIMRRLLRGLPVFRPDRRHIHHRLLELGFSRRRAVLVLYAISALCLAVAFAVFWLQGRYLPLFAGLLFFILICAGRLCGLTGSGINFSGFLGKSMEHRREIQRALVLSRWLELEAARFHSVEELWDDYRFIVRKLGFLQVRLIAPGGIHVWRESGVEKSPANDGMILRHAVGENTVLEFSPARGAASSTTTLTRLLAEIAAEAWHKAHMRLPRSRVLRPARFVPVPLSVRRETPKSAFYPPPEPAAL